MSITGHKKESTFLRYVKLTKEESLKQLSERLNISRTTISRYRKENKIPYLKVGNNIRYEYNKVLKSLER